jgi:hypothetical protein
MSNYNTENRKKKKVVGKKAPFKFNSFIPAALSVVLSFLERQEFQVITKVD